MKVSSFFWNVRGLGNHKTVEMLLSLLKLHKPLLVFLSSEVLFKFFDIHLMVTSPIVNKSSKLWCLSIPNLVQNFLVNDQFISVSCHLHDKFFSFAGVYGVNTYLVRRFLWRDLSSFLWTLCILGDFNNVWTLCILGDFNDVLLTDECGGGGGGGGVGLGGGGGCVFFGNEKEGATRRRERTRAPPPRFISQ